MLTLEQVRAVNDGLTRGDWNAALQPLEEQIDLRHAELPKMEKPAIAALIRGLQTPETAQFWANAAFAPNVSVRRFIRRTFLGLKEDAAPLGLPLQSALENFWSSETPLPFANTSREAAARREQFETVQSAIEILLRCDPIRFMNFWATLNEAARPARAQQQVDGENWRKSQQAYSSAYEAATNEVLAAQFGEDIVTSNRRWQLPSRVWNEIRAEVDNRADIKVLLEAMGESPWATAALEWHPEQLFQSALGPYMAQNATGPQRKVTAEIRDYLWALVDAAFDEKLSKEEQKAAGLRLRELLPAHWMNNWLGREQMWERLPALLQQWRPDVSQMTPEAAGKSAWFGLAQALAFSLQRPYNIEPKDWNPPAEITPEMLRSWKIPEQEQYGVNYYLENAASSLEEKNGKPKQEEPAVLDSLVNELEEAVSDLDLALEMSEVEINLDNFGLGYFSSEWVKAQQEQEKTGENFQSITRRWREEKVREIRAIKTSAERVEKLLNPPLYLDSPVPRLSLWNIWSVDDANLKEGLWPLVSTQLWASYEEKLESYRRVETDEIAPKLGEKLTARELKDWKAGERAHKRSLIASEIQDLNSLFRTVEGLDGELKMLRLLERPGVRDLHKNQQRQLLGLAADTYYFNRNKEQGISEQQLRDSWFLEEHWRPLVAELETALLSAKRLNDWEKQSFNQQLAIAHYRLNTPESRKKFLELAAEADHLAANLATPITILKDTEAWLLIMERMEWAQPQMRDLWTQTRAQNNQEAEDLAREVLQRLSFSTHEKSTKFQIELLNDVPIEELAQHVDLVKNCLESALIAVKRWSLATLTKIGDTDADTVQLVGEMLWSENSALVKEAIKFLGAQRDEVAESAWESLQDALTLENQTILELTLRALSTLKTKNDGLELNETSRERVAELAELAPARFAKLAKRLTDN